MRDARAERARGVPGTDPAAASLFWRNQRDLELALGRHDEARFPTWPSTDEAIERAARAALSLPIFVQAQAYVARPAVRRMVVDRVLDELRDAPAGGLVLVGYSLGSLVAAQLLAELPDHLTARLVVTMGSPLWHGTVQDLRRDSFRPFPYARVGAWLNLRGRLDPVTGGRSLAAVLPQVVDRAVPTGTGLGAHALERYVDQDDLVRALDWVGRPPVRGVAPRPADLDPSTLRVVVGTQWALRVEQHLPVATAKEREIRTRFAAARAVVVDETAAELRRSGVDPAVAARLDRDNRELIRERLTPTETVAALISAYLQNPVEPYVIGFPGEARDGALQALATDLGVSTSWADTVVRTWERVGRDGRTVGIRPTWALAAVAGMGLALVAPIAVMAAAPAGLAGGAAIVGGLAALGPGGMAGGLGIVALIGGTGGIVAGGGVMGALATRGSVPEVKQAVDIACVLAASRDELTGEPRGEEWTMLTLMRDQLGTEIERHHTISDPGAAALKSLEAKRERVAWGIAWLERNGLVPAALVEG